MASIGEVGEGLNKVLDKAAEAGEALQNAAELAEDAQRLLTGVAEGTLQADVETTKTAFVQAVAGIGELHEALGSAMTCVEQILHGLEVGSGGGGGSRQRQGQAFNTSGSEARGTRRPPRAVLLPEGSALTVFEVTGSGVNRKTYWGGAKSPWR